MRDTTSTTFRTALARRGAIPFVAAVATAMVAGFAPAPVSATTPTPRRIVTGWGYFSSTSSSALTSVQDNASLFSEISPFWYSATWDGASPGISATGYAANKATVLPALRATGVKVIPTITDGMAARRMATVLASPNDRAKLVNSIVAVVTSNDYDGIDLDFEGFAFADGSSSWASTRPRWTAFVSQLSAALHAQGKLLSVTTPYLTSATTGYWVYDWAGIGAHVDRLRVMTYDYHVSAAGPIAPFPWVEAVTKYAVSVVASGKVQMGVASYGRDWKTGTTYSGVVSTCPTVGPRGATSAQQAALASAISWATASRYTFTAAASGAFLTTVRSAPFDAPGVTVVRAPVSSWDATAKERTFATALTFSGRHDQNVATTGTAAKAATHVTVASTAGIAAGLGVAGAGVSAGTTVTAVSPSTRVVTLSAPTTTALAGTRLTFAGLVNVACTVARTGWLDEAGAALARAALVGTYHLAGIAQWTIGGEDAAQWAKLRAYATSIAPNPTAVTLHASSPITWGRASSVVVTARSAGLPAVGATVTLQARPSGASAFTTVASAVTSSTGVARFAPVVTGNVVYRAIVASSFERAPGTAVVSVGVRTAVFLTQSATATTPGHTVSVLARLRPIRVGQTAILQVKVSGHWVSLATARADRYGRTFFTVRPTVRHATTAYRLAVLGTGSTSGAYAYFSVHLG